MSLTRVSLSFGALQKIKFSCVKSLLDTSPVELTTQMCSKLQCFLLVTSPAGLSSCKMCSNLQHILVGSSKGQVSSLCCTYVFAIFSLRSPRRPPVAIRCDAIQSDPSESAPARQRASALARQRANAPARQRRGLPFKYN